MQDTIFSACDWWKAVNCGKGYINLSENLVYVISLVVSRLRLATPLVHHIHQSFMWGGIYLSHTVPPVVGTKESTTNKYSMHLRVKSTLYESDSTCQSRRSGVLWNKQKTKLWQKRACANGKAKAKTKCGELILQCRRLIASTVDRTSPNAWVAIGHAVVYHAWATHAFSAGIKCRHCLLRKDVHSKNDERKVYW